MFTGQAKNIGTSGAVITIIISAVAALLLVIIAMKSRTAKSIGLDYNQKGTSAVDDYRFLIGMNGKALSDLRPSGTALIDGERYAVVTDGEYIEEDSDIVVKEIEGTRINVTLNERR